MIFALIPAAGKSERMGRPKLALPYARSTVLQTVIETVRNAGIEHALVIVGPHVPELVPLAEEAHAHVLLLEQQTPDMRATVENGLCWLDEHFHPTRNDWWLLVPGDHPTLDEAIVRRLLEARHERPECSIFLPSYAGKRGHPALLNWKHAAGIQAFPSGSGFNRYLRQFPAETVEMRVDSARVLCDLDTPEDYVRLQSAP